MKFLLLTFCRRIRLEVRKYIRRQFDWVARKYRAHTVVEKTCANSLRVSFVDRVVPEAKYIFIRRDGLDAVGSATKRWKAELDIPYLARKARFVPYQDLPYYALQYFGNRVYRLLSREKRLAFWGPKLDNMQELLKQHTLEEICALQWKRCVERAEVDFAGMDQDKVCRVRYEGFTEDPGKETRRVLDFLGVPAEEEELKRAVADVRPARKSSWEEKLSEDEQGKVLGIIESCCR